MNSLILLAVLSYLSFIRCKFECEEFKTCGECIAYAEERCVWCTQKEMFDKDVPRCQLQIHKDNGTWCPSHLIQDPEPFEPNPNATEDKPFSATKGHEVQFHPQKMTINLRPGIAVPFNIFYHPAKGYPLDLYFLLDNTKTMAKYANDLQNQALEIYDKLTSITNNVRMGIGSFIEKPALPYANAIAYAFKNHLALTKDMDEFKRKIKSHNYGGNYDSPEAGLDALMQVMKCTPQIGWRIGKNTDTEETVEISRKIIIMVTDSTYHTAGDGKLIGAFEQNDMKCYLDKDHVYGNKKALELDYPSPSQINWVAKENNFIIIFVAPSTHKDVYENLKKEIFGSMYVALDKERISDITINSYNAASREVRLRPINLDQSIKLKIDCENQTTCVFKQGSPMLAINAEIKATKCKINEESTASFYIQLYGISDKIHITVEIDCKCSCEDSVKKNAEECKGVGDLECGICKCSGNRSGNKCENNCNAAMTVELRKKCKQKNDDVVCNGLSDAKCVCGECQCPEGYSGKFCEHDNKSCFKTCPKEKGKCKNGKCICIDPLQWTGDTCNCLVGNTTCIGPFSEEPCSGRGTCSCGQCKCATVDGKSYYGAYCEACQDCGREICQLLGNYTICSYETWKQENKVNQALCNQQHNQNTVEEVLIMSKTQFEEEKMASDCKKTLENGKNILYKYEFVKDVTGAAKLKLMIQDETEDPPIAEYWYVIAGVIGGILLVGLLTLIIWKITTDIYDKREYNKFCEEAEKNGFDVKNYNPVYEAASTNYINPAYQSQNQ